MSSNSSKALLQRFRTWFPDREISVRSQDKVHTIHISSLNQKLAFGASLSLLGVWCGSLAGMTLSSEYAKAALAEREIQVAQAEAHVARYHKDIKNIASDLEQRQAFLEQVVDAHIGEPEGDIGNNPSVDSNSAASQSTDRVQKIVHDVHSAEALAQIERKQFALVARLTHFADARSSVANQTIRGLGLNPKTFSQYGVGGPLEKLSTAKDGSLDARFARMGESLARMNILENGMASIPQVNPTHVAAVSSSFGYRSDPFTGAGAFHAGLDFPGPTGSPIYAAAKGKVTFVGVKSGYGNCVEITHGNGLMTRYAHLSSFRIHAGQTVDGGTLIAAMGSTGRSTGPHLHFEVRVQDRPVNPRKFLETAQHGLAMSQAQKGSLRYG